jgi:hypothetical protein
MQVKKLSDTRRERTQRPTNLRVASAQMGGGAQSGG